eukprot:GHUV01030740.1.p3 GENE.GHUV01030740.1~~GHUV01030740.1.p3  ORF type:complete len:105 (+),score=15.56 GHUV01030740.1:123-437(+)
MRETTPQHASQERRFPAKEPVCRIEAASGGYKEIGRMQSADAAGGLPCEKADEVCFLCKQPSHGRDHQLQPDCISSGLPTQQYEWPLSSTTHFEHCWSEAAKTE